MDLISKDFSIINFYIMEALNYVILVLFVGLMVICAIGAKFFVWIFDLWDYFSFLFEEKSEDLKAKVIDFEEKKKKYDILYYIFIETEDQKKYKIRVINQAEFEFYSEFAIQKKKKKTFLDFSIEKKRFETSYRFISLCKFL